MEERLRSLRLPGILENLDIRTSQAEESQLGYLEFLSFLIQDEYESRNSNSLTKAIRAANFGEEKTLEGFDFRFNQKWIPQATVRDLGTCGFVEKKKNIVLVGPTGIGKTHLAKALGHEACRRRYSVLFTKTYSILEQLQDDLSRSQLMKLWRKLAKTDLLIFDDFGFRKMTTREAELFYSLVDERIGKGSMIFTSNRPPEDWMGLFPDPVIGGAILDRIVSDAHKIISTEGKSYRKNGERNSV
jgi:DNA replication protein DnaC